MALSLFILFASVDNKPDTIPPKKEAPKLEMKKQKKSEAQLQMIELNEIIYKLDSTKVDTTRIKKK